MDDNHARIHDAIAATGLDTDMFEPTLQGLLRNPLATRAPWDYVGRPNVVGVMRG